MHTMVTEAEHAAVTEAAYAKINIGLDVLRRRPDGYHELRMVMQTVGLHDDVILTREEMPGIRLSCDRPGLPADRRNLAYRAAEVMQERFGLGGVSIVLRKRIPAEAGLAGGSADAAAVLRGMAKLYGLDVKPETLRELGLPLGADIPYCVCGGTAVAAGIGEKLTFLPDPAPCTVVIMKPDFDLSTGAVYGALHIEQRNAADHPDMDAVIAAGQAGDLIRMAEHMGNILELPALEIHPEIAAIKAAFLRAGASGASMTGSGSAVFGIFPDLKTAERCPELLREEFGGAAKEIYLTSPVGRVC